MFYYFTKRLMDIILSIILIILFSPLMLLTAIIIKITSPGPALVEESNSHMKRVGKNGKIFRLYKFRSMPTNSDSILTSDPKFRKLLQEWKKSNFKLHEDPRVTKFGKIIRKFPLMKCHSFLMFLKAK
jgi:lipopolysaccharide/colanic/teichoic acid biosynthesis glycosyltransferase